MGLLEFLLETGLWLVAGLGAMALLVVALARAIRDWLMVYTQFAQWLNERREGDDGDD
jgi:hypothetical protein